MLLDLVQHQVANCMHCGVFFAIFVLSGLPLFVLLESKCLLLLERTL